MTKGKKFEMTDNLIYETNPIREEKHYTRGDDYE